MANVFEKMDKLVMAGLMVLDRELVLPQLVARNFGGSFRGAAGDTIKVKVGAYTTADKRDLRVRGTIATKDLSETHVDVKLTDHIFHRSALSLEEASLDLTDFTSQVSVPAVKAVARQLEDEVVGEMNAATFAAPDIAIDPADPYLAINQANTVLHKHHVPMDERYCVVGADVAEAFLASDRLTKVDQSGDNTALREATIGRIGSLNVVVALGLPPGDAVVAHREAFTLANVAPTLPPQAGNSGAAASSQSYQGLNMTGIASFNDDYIESRFGMHTFAGTSTTMDAGTRDVATGVFTPTETPALDGSDKILVRAVKLAMP